MSKLPAKEQQIIQVHGPLIYQVATVCQHKQPSPELDSALQVAEQQGWGKLVAAIREIMNGRRDLGVLNGLDEEDRVIVEAILRGIQDPATLPDPNAKPDASLAAPGLASMIHAAAGNVQAYHMLATMAEQMSSAGGDMARLAAAIKPMVDGERDADKLSRGMGPLGKGLLNSILEELARLSLH